MRACEHIVVNDKTSAIVSMHDSREEAIRSIEERGYEHHSGLTYRNPKTRDYVHVTERSQTSGDLRVISMADSIGLSVDAYLQMVR